MEQNDQNEIVKKGKFWRFIRRAVSIFLVLILFLTVVGLSPTPVKELNNYFFSLFIKDSPAKISDEIKSEEAQGERDGEYTEPTRIVIPSIKLDNPVLNPNGTSIPVLDAALLKGAVRYPGSGDLESKRNMFILGHSSYLPVVHNQAYKAFNGIQNLKAGDLIEVYGTGKKYVYAVEKIEKTIADDGFIDISNFERKLILATCDSFGKKQDRFIVTARFIEVLPQ